jgi:hypothetical protein
MGFDTSRCRIPVARPDEQIANVPDPEPESGLGLSVAALPPMRTAARVERQEAPRAHPSRARRHVVSVRSRAFRNRRHVASRPKRHRTREARRAYREALFQSYRRTLVGASQ